MGKVSDGEGEDITVDFAVDAFALIVQIEYVLVFVICLFTKIMLQTFFVTEPSSASPPSDPSAGKAARACNACYETVFPILDPLPDEEHLPPSDSGGTLSSFPQWMSMPSLPMFTRPEALMRTPSATVIRPSASASPKKPRPRSLVQMREEMESSSNTGVQETVFEEEYEDEALNEEEEVARRKADKARKRHTIDMHPAKKEDTVRRHKRFSFPAVALQPTSVTARSGFGGGEREHGSTPHPQNLRLSRRLSLVLGKSRERGTRDARSGEQDLGSGMAAEKLYELLGKTTASPRQVV